MQKKITDKTKSNMTARSINTKIKDSGQIQEILTRLGTLEAKVKALDFNDGDDGILNIDDGSESDFPKRRREPDQVDTLQDDQKSKSSSKMSQDEDRGGIGNAAVNKMLKKQQQSINDMTKQMRAIKLKLS